MIPGGPPDEPRSRLDPSVEEDVRRELESHLALHAKELVEEGWSEPDARAEALRRFGDFEAARRSSEEEARAHARAVRRSLRLRGFADDLRVAVRRLARSPRFTLVAVLTLTVAVGANAAVFSLLHGVLLDPLPYPTADRLVWIEEAHQGPDGSPDPVPWLNFRDWRRGTRSFETMAAFRPESIPFPGRDGPVRAVGALVSKEFWDVFRPEVLLGRFPKPEEHRPGADVPVVISERFWRAHLGADSAVVGSTFPVSGISATIVGVLATGFHFPGDSEYWTPAEASSPAASRTAHNWRVAGLLRDGVGVSTADGELDRLSVEMTRTLPGDDHDLTGAVVTPLRSAVVGEVPDTLYLLMATGGLLLLIACTSLASTVMARGVRRARDLAVRAALGASRSRLLRQLIAEGALVSLGGAALGLGLAALLVAGIRNTGIDAIPRLGGVGIRWEVVAFTLGLAVLTTILCGLVPALRATGKPFPATIRSGFWETGAPTRVWRLLVGGQVAFAAALLTVGGVLLQSFVRVVTDDPGFTQEGIVTVGMTLPVGSDSDLDAPSDLHRRIVEVLRARPEMADVAVANVVPLHEGTFPVGRILLDHDPESISPPGVYLAVSPGYFHLLEIDVVAGRVFTEEDDADAPHVAVVSRGFADRLWPGEDPLGKVITSPGMDSFWEEMRWARVVGVVEDVKYRELYGRPWAAYYFPAYQRPYRASRSFFVLARSSAGEPTGLAGDLRGSLRTLAPDVPLSVRSMEERTRDSLATRRLTLQLVGGFAITALLLTGLGMYGVLSYLVESRRQEMGIRLVLGAGPRAVRRRVLGDGLRMMIGGLVAGGGLLALALPLVRSFLQGIALTDPATLLAVVSLLLAVGTLAAWVPAVRATRIDVARAVAAE